MNIALESQSILAHENFSLSDFSRRWQMARLAPIKAAFGDKMTTMSEDILLAWCNDQSQDLQDQILKEIYLNSWRFGNSVKRFYRLIWDISDFRDLLQQCGSPCLQGRWRESGAAIVLQRSHCEGSGRSNHFACDYWREAADGLVTGCGDTARFVRLGNKLRNDSQCEDIIFDDQARQDKDAMYAPVPLEIEAELSKIVASVSKLKVNFQLEGYREGTLYFRFNPSTAQDCSSVPAIAKTFFEQSVAQNLSGVKTVDVTPRAVL